MVIYKQQQIRIIIQHVRIFLYENGGTI